MRRMMKRVLKLLVTIGILVLLSATQADQTVTIQESQFTIRNSFDLQTAIDAARPGDVIRVPPGIYYGNFLIEKPLSLEGINWPVLDGQNQGNVIEINDAPGVTIRGFVIRNSGAKLEKENAGIAVDKSPRLTVENNRLENTLFGVYIKESEGSRIAHNIISSKDLDVPARGDGIRVWYSQNSEVVGNRVDKARDVVLWYNNGSLIRDNVITNGRYGLHFMYCDDNLVENNYVSGNSVGAFLMYSRRLTLQHNIFSHNRGPSGYGIGMKDLDGVEATDNLFSSNRVGMYFDNSPWSVDVSQHFSHNAFVHNDIGLLFTPSVRRNHFSQNSFIDNLEQVALTGSGTFQDNFFTVEGVGNFWSDYAGYDEGGDGIGDLAYESKSLFENMMDANPPLRMFQLSPAQQAVDLAAQAFPIFQPKPKFVDEAPLMIPIQPAVILPESGPTWPMWALAAGLALVVGMIILFGVTTMKAQEAKGLPTATNGGPMIKVAGLTKQFGNFTAVDEVSFEVAAGQSVALWGVNGAGKTTIIRCILGLLSGQGTLSVNGHNAAKAGKKARAAIGYVPQELAFHDDLSARDTLRFYAQLKNAAVGRIDLVLAEVGLSDQGDKLVGALSGGMKQRLALALALLADPPILLLDEPTSSLDTKAREDFIKLLLKQKAEGKTLLFTSHRLEEVSALADQVLVLAQGKLVQTCHQPTDLADQLGMQASLKLIVPEAARAIALNLLLAQGFSAQMNGVGLRVDVSPNAKTAPLRALLAENIDVHNFEVDNGHEAIEHGE